MKKEIYCEKCGRLKGKTSHACRINTTIRRDGASYYPKVCLVCNKYFETKCRTSKMCSRICSYKFFSKNFSKENHPRWRSGKGNHSSGYKTIWIGKHKYALEHRHIMELSLKRKLKQDEDVHHLNGIKTDNRIKNLKVMSKSEHHYFHASDDYKNNKGYIWEKNHRTK